MTPFTQLRTFLEVYRARSISGGAQSLGITQPAASQHVQSLEALMGRRLFDRRVRGVEPTSVAEELAMEIAPLLDGLDIGFSRLRARTEAIEGTIRIVGPSEFMRARMVAPLADLGTVGLNVRVTLGGREVIYDALRSGDVDLAVTASRPTDKQIGHTRIAEETLVPVASPGWVRRVLSGRRALDAALAHAPVAYDEQLPLIKTFFENGRDGNEPLIPSVVAPDLRMVRDFVEAGVGWSVIPDYLVDESLRARKLIRLKAPGVDVKNALYLAWLKTSLRHPRVSFARQRLLDAFS